MTTDQRAREQSLAYDLETGDDWNELVDDPMTRNRDHKENRKAKQLCRQVAETLDLVLSGDCSDELLLCLQVISVVPAPNASRMLVTVSADMPDDGRGHQEILDRLNEQSGRLRAEIAASINRKRVPTLVFQVVAPFWGTD